jgi:hypothetical protein
MTQQHSPIPWDIQNKGNLYGRDARVEVVMGSNLDGSRLLPKIVRMPDISDLSYANARFIVQACNAHEELLAALKAFVAIANLQGLLPATLAQARAAIGKAEGT